MTSYQAQVWMGNETWRNCTTNSEKRSCLLEGLVQKAKHNFRVRALNEKGPSKWSDGPIETGYTGML